MQVDDNTNENNTNELRSDSNNGKIKTIMFWTKIFLFLDLLILLATYINRPNTYLEEMKINHQNYENKYKNSKYYLCGDKLKFKYINKINSENVNLTTCIFEDRIPDSIYNHTTILFNIEIIKPSLCLDEYLYNNLTNHLIDVFNIPQESIFIIPTNKLQIYKVKMFIRSNLIYKYLRDHLFLIRYKIINSWSFSDLVCTKIKFYFETNSGIK